ncbi:MAG: hypothetical protein AAFN77_07870 [Planctomycetota bacterium]
MSEELLEENDPLLGATTGDVASDSVDDNETEKDKSWELFNLYNCMLMLSLLFITAATFRLIMVLRDYSPSWPFGGAPWETGVG